MLLHFEKNLNGSPLFNANKNSETYYIAEKNFLKMFLGRGGARVINLLEVVC